MRLKTVIKGVAALVVLLVVVALAGAGIFVATFDANAYRATVEKRVKAATGRDLHLKGPVQARIFSLRPAIAAERVRFQNADWGSRDTMATVDRVAVEIALLPLVTGNVQVERVVLEGADIILERNEAGRGNWQMAPAEKPAPKAETAGGGAPADLPRIRHVTLRDVTVAWRDATTGRRIDATVDRFTARTADWGADIDVGLDATYNGTPVTLTGTVGPLAHVTDGAPWNLNVVAEAGDARLTVAGAVARPLEGRGLDLSVDGQGDSVARVAALAPGMTATPVLEALGPFSLEAKVTGGVEAGLTVADLEAGTGRDGGFTATVSGRVGNALEPRDVALDVTAGGPVPDAFGAPALPPVDATASVRDKGPQTWLVRDLALDAGKSGLSGEADVKLGGKRPSLRLVLEGDHLDLRPFMAAGGAAEKAPAPKDDGDGRVIPDTPLPVAALKTADAHVKVAVGRLIMPTLRAAEATVTADLADGTLRLKPVAATLGGGRLSGAIDVTPKGDGGTAEVTVQAAGDGMALGRLLREVNATEQLTGAETSVDVALTGRGNTVRDVAGSLDGHATLDMGEGRIDNTLLEAAASDIGDSLAQRLNPLTESRDYTALHCMAMRLTAEEGVLAGDPGLGVETERIIMLGDGAVNLGTEEMDIGLRPDAKEGLGVSLGDLSGLVRLKGTLGAPQVVLDPGGTLKAFATVGAAVATSGASLVGQVLFDKATAETDPCRTVREGPDSGNGQAAEQDRDPDAGAADSRDATPGEAAEQMGEDFKKLFGQ